MVKIEKLKLIKESIAIKRFFITLILTVSISLFYFNLYKFLETPKISLIKKFEISNAFVWIEKDIKSGFFFIEKTYEYKINYPYIIKRPFYCYDLPKNATYYLKNGEKLEVNFLNDKICISSQIKEFIVKEVDKTDFKNFIRFVLLDNTYKIIVKNLFDFPINIEVRIDVKTLMNKEANVYRDGILVLSNASFFFDSRVIAPYGNIEYEIRRN